jgi:hypothetical protein
MIMNKISIDTNVLIYNHAIDGDAKQLIADSLFDNVPVISTSVLIIFFVYRIQRAGYRQCFVPCNMSVSLGGDDRRMTQQLLYVAYVCTAFQFTEVHGSFKVQNWNR